MSDIFNLILSKHGKDAKIVPHGTYTLRWSVQSRSTGDNLGEIEYADKENDPIRRSSLRMETVNRKN